MGYDDDPYRDEDGEPLMDYDDIQSDGEQPQQIPPNDDVQDFNDFNEDVDDDDGENWGMQDDSPKSNPVESSKSRKRLIKKSGNDDNHTPSEFNDFADDDEVGEAAYDDIVAEKRKGKGAMTSDEGRGEKRKEKKKLRKDKFSTGGGGGDGGSSGAKPKLSLKRRKSGGNGEVEPDADVNEMWATIAGADSEDDHDGTKTLDDDNFIDDTGVDPSDRYEEGGSPSRFAQAEEGEDEEELFRPGKKKKKNERSAAEIADLVERLMAELELVVEEDAIFNQHGKPAINKLRKLPLLVDALSKKQLQHEFLDHGVLTLLKNWLEPLPDGSLPNINIREAILRILTDFPIDLDQYDRREQLKKSGLGKVIMFLSRSDEETTSNRKLAKELVDKWSRPIFNKSTRFEDMRNHDEERVQRRPPVRRPANKASALESHDDDLEFSSGRKAGPSGARLHASRPEATPMDFTIRPQSKVDPDEIRARSKQGQQDERRMKMNKKLQQLKQMKRRKLQATKVSVEGRGMVKYL
ncbi:protein IWS1 homolog 1 [Silene latifolia]|uniref:protein IWS1 homolog 1 n=1 Tax=Silene latifolia TaxID=37657 RepID=UPI003D785A75